MIKTPIRCDRDGMFFDADGVYIFEDAGWASNAPSLHPERNQFIVDAINDAGRIERIEAANPAKGGGLCCRCLIR